MLLLLVVYAAWGGPTHGARLFTHLALAGLLFAAAMAPAEVLERRGLTRTLVAAGVVTLASQATGLLPIPSVLGGLIAPSWTFDRGDVSWDWSSLHAGFTIEAMTSTIAVLGVALLGHTLLQSRRYAVLTIRLAGAFILFAAIGLRALPNSPYALDAPPFVDNNHFGAAFAITYPALLGGALQKGRDIAERFAWAVAAVIGVLYVASLESQGPVLACLLVTIPIAVRPWWIRGGLVVGLGAALSVYALGLEQRGGVTHGRATAWLEGLRGLLDHWLLGAGSGTFEVFLQPYRADREFHSWNHAHNDWLEWVLEGGVVGTAALLVVLVLLARPAPARRQLPEDSRLLKWCVLVFLFDALTEFPFHLPLLAMCVALVYTWWRGVFHQVPRVSPRWVRLSLVGAAALNLAAAPVHLRGAVIQSEETAYIEERQEPTWLPWLAPNHEITLIEQAKAAFRAGDRDKAKSVLELLYVHHMRNPRALRVAAELANVAGMDEQAMKLAERARAWGPSDVRNWRVWARTVSRIHPEQTLDAWTQAMEHGFMVHKEALAAFPNGIAWAVRVEQLQKRSALKLASMLIESDPEASLFAYEALRRKYPDAYPIEYLQALVKTKHWEQADAYWTSLPSQRQRSEEALRLKARTAEALGDYETASRAWNQIWLNTEKPGARSRAMQLIARVSTPEAVITALHETESLHGKLTLEEVLLLADSHRRARQPNQCAGALASRDFTRAQKNLRRRAFKLQARCHRPDEDQARNEAQPDEPNGESERDDRNP